MTGGAVAVGQVGGIDLNVAQAALLGLLGADEFADQELVDRGHKLT